MRRRHISLIVLGSVTALLALPLSATAQSTPKPVDPEKHEADSMRIPEISTFAYTQNMHPMGYSPRVVPLANAQPGAGIFNSDLAFWGKTAYQGTYEGFRTVDVTEPDHPVEINNFTGCVQGTTTGNQSDVIIWENILVRSWNSPTPAGGRFCGNLFTPAGQEGVHVFDVSDPTEPVGMAFVATPCGSHTATGIRTPPTTGCWSTTARPAERSDAAASTSSRCHSTTHRLPRICASSPRVTLVRHCRTW
jgi:hypothetical protein